jgi:hypothetical protein
MRSESLTIIDQSISQLHELAGVLAEEVGSASADQIPLTLSVLLPKLEAAKRIAD